MPNYERTPTFLSNRPHAGFAVELLSLLLAVLPARAPTPAEINNLRNTIGDRIEAATILGGDFGMTGASYNKGSGGNLTHSKFGDGVTLATRNNWKPCSSPGSRSCRARWAISRPKEISLPQMSIPIMVQPMI